MGSEIQESGYATGSAGSVGSGFVRVVQDLSLPRRLPAGRLGGVMSQRLNVLISAYACEPNKGSEPEVGWQWALQMARFHDVTVLTRANNRPAIELALEFLRGRQPLPKFVYHDRNAFFLDLKRRAGAVKFYYLLWQKSAREVIARLHDVHHYDLMHHVTFAGFRYPVAIWGHGVPCLWGPIGGIESIPRGLLPWHHLASLIHELGRNANNLLQATPFHVLPKRARATTLILVSTPEMQRTFARLNFQAQLMPTIGLSTNELPYRPHAPSSGPLKLLFVGNIITLKGVDLALQALHQSKTNAILTLVGTGNYVETAKRLVAILGLSRQVTFLGRLPRSQVLQMYPDYDLFVFPSLHDTGGYAVIEAMFNELPVICLDCGGPAVAVRDQCGTKVPLGRRAKVIADLAAAFRWYDQNRAAIPEQGRRARAAVLEHYDWNVKGERMNECYSKAIALAQAQNRRKEGYSGMGSLVNLLHTMFTLKGLAATATGLFLVGAMGFLSIGHLKHQASDIVTDTLPGLTYAGQANANLAQAFDCTLMFLMADDPDQRARLRKDIEALSQQTTVSLTAYKQAVFEAQDQLLFDTILKRRAEYVVLREKTIQLVEANQRSAAVTLCQTGLLPAYHRYKEAGERLFEFNIRQGQVRGETIMHVSTVTQWAVAIIGVVVFLVGFLIGLFK